MFTRALINFLDYLSTVLRSRDLIPWIQHSYEMGCNPLDATNVIFEYLIDQSEERISNWQPT